MAKKLEIPGIEPGAFHMQSERSTTELYPRFLIDAVAFTADNESVVTADINNYTNRSRFVGRSGSSVQYSDGFILNASAEQDRAKVMNNFRDCKITVGVFASDLCAKKWLDTSHLRGEAGSGRASCIGGATFSHRRNSTTPLKLMQIGTKVAQELQSPIPYFKYDWY
ncbi:hypothetical protein PUN28_008423 [Cardiocondyla obscurior]|uniref:Uncharacterized protein n=1 Tax=Cardiocondyla obscurior TaxID=286306 RepID=A0AAW2FXQ5_9HYME